MFRKHAAPSPPQSVHALLREPAFIDEPQEVVGTNQVVEGSRVSEIQQASSVFGVSASSLLPSRTTTTVRLHTSMAAPVMMVQSATHESRHPNWIPLRERNHRRRLTPPDLETIVENFEEDDCDVMVLEGDGHRGVPTESRAEMAGSLKKKRGHRRNNCLLMGDFFDVI